MIPQKEPFKIFLDNLNLMFLKSIIKITWKSQKECFPEWLFIYQKQIVESCLKLISEALITILSLFSDMNW